MCDNCKCNQEVKLEWVESEVGQQLKFAVPESGMNEPSVDVVEELRGEISDFFMGVREIMIKNYGKYSNTVVVIHDMYSKEIMEIIDSYRK